MTVLESDNRLMGYTWGQEETIILGGSLGLRRVPVSGGAPEQLTRTDNDAGDVRHIQPHVLPDGRAVLFTERSFLGAGSRRIMALSLGTGEVRAVLDNAANAKYVQPGHLVYLVDGVLHAVAFDADRLEVTGPPIPLVEGIQTRGETGAANYDVSIDGTLVYTVVRAVSGLRLLSGSIGKARCSLLAPQRVPTSRHGSPRTDLPWQCRFAAARMTSGSGVTAPRR